jgi:hypothetical protein
MFFQKFWQDVLIYVCPKEKHNDYAPAGHNEVRNDSSVQNVQSLSASMAKDNISLLPASLLVKIFMLHYPRQIGRLSSVSKLFYAIANQPVIWRTICLKFNLSMRCDRGCEWKVLFKEDVYQLSKARGPYELTLLECLPPKNIYLIRIKPRQCQIKHIKKILVEDYKLPMSPSHVVILNQGKRLSDDRYVHDEFRALSGCTLSWYNSK